MKKQILSLAAGAALVFAAQSSFAVTLTAPGSVGTLSYEALLTAGCEATVIAPAGLLANQATYDGDATASAGSVTVMCSNVDYKLCLDAGLNPSAATDAGRQLAGDGTGTAVATDLLAYTLTATATSGSATSATLVGDKDCNGVGGYASALAPTVDNGISDTGDGATTITYALTADVTIPLDSVPGTYKDTVAVNIVW